MIVKLNNIFDIYENYICKGCTNKKKIILFERNKMSNINYIYNVLLSGNYIMNSYNLFLIKYPKYRIVMSLKMNDKIINHYITMNALIPKLSHYLDNRNIATRKNMGTDYGVKLVKKYLEKNKKYNKFYILKLDISKYFYNIDHDILKNMLKDLDDIEYKIISTIIDSTNYDSINENIGILKRKESIFSNRLKELNDIPIYKFNKGLPIGNMTSQFLAIYYLHELDHYIIHNLKIKYMVRYMDDYILIHQDKEYLKKSIIIIENILNEKYKLKLNDKKTKIYNIENGFDFLGYKFSIKNNKTICKISPKTLKILKIRIKKLNNNNFKKFFCSFNNYYYSFKYCNNMYFKRYINKYITNVNVNQNCNIHKKLNNLNMLYQTSKKD